MSKIKRKFSIEEKLSIFQEGENHGVGLICRQITYNKIFYYQSIP